jgi:phenylalanyl-tRNA synthetase beta chain
MASVILNKKKFEREIGKLDEKMQDRISLFGTPIEKITDDNVELEIFPNRPDMLSYEGFKRAFLAFLDKKTGLRTYKLNKPEKDYKVIIESSLKNIRPYTACTIVKGLKLDDEKIKELVEIQEKLHLTLGRKRKKVAIGIYPLEKIKLPITFKALEPDKIKFIPLETDREMSGLQILQKHSAGREYAHLLAGKEKFPIFVDSNNNILSMPPIINSQLTGKITNDTKEVFVESSGFDYPTLKKCLNIIVTILADMGGEIYQMEIQSDKKNKEITPDLETEKMKISIENTNKLLGLDLNERQIKKLLERMGYDYNNKMAEIPAWRVDVLHEVDLIEDIAIAYGYENFVPEIPSDFTFSPKHMSEVASIKIATTGEENPKEIIKRKISEILSGLGLLETSSFHLTMKENQFRKMGNQSEEARAILIKESKTDYNILRNDLSHYMLKIFSENVDSEYPQRTFEIGKVFSSEKNDITEKENLTIAITPGNFTELRQILEYLGRMIDKKISFKESSEFPMHFTEGRVAEILINNKKAGFIGEIHPKILKNWKLKMPTALLEISLEEVFE